MDASSIQQLFQQNNPYEQFVQQLVALESRQKLQFEERQEEETDKKKALGDVSESISKFVSKLDELQSPANKAFQPIQTSSSDETAVRVNSAGGIDRPSNFNIQVGRLASNDTALSEVMMGDDTNLATQGDGSVNITIGDKTETISVATQKEAEDGTMVDKTNSEILDSFAEAISLAFEDEARASVFNVNNDEVQFSIQSLVSGEEGAVQIDGATGVLGGITGTMTKLKPEDELDAEFTVDGVTFQRSTNTVDDAIDGLSFTMLKENTGNVQMSAQRDLEAARGNLDEFIESFNEMNQKIRERTFVDGDNNTRGPLRGMRSIRNLTLNLRQTALLGTEGAEPGQLSRLAEIGMSFENNGKMVVDDGDMLEEALEQRPDEVAELFRSESSAITTMKEQAEAYTKSNGIISSLENGVDQTIDRLDNRIAQQERYLEQYEEQQRDIFNNLQQIIDEGNSQFEEVMSFRQGMGL